MELEYQQNRKILFSPLFNEDEQMNEVLEELFSPPS